MHASQIPQPGTIPTFDPARQRPQMPSSLELVVNALDIPITFELGGYSGSPSMIFTLAPGEQAWVPKSYCEPIPGASPNRSSPSVMAQLTSVEPYPGGVQIQGVVPIAQWERTNREWKSAKANAPKTSIVMLQDKDGNQVNLAIPRQRPAPTGRPVRADDADEDDGDDAIEDPPPDVPDIRAAAPAASPPKANGKPKGAAKAAGPKSVSAPTETPEG